MFIIGEVCYKWPNQWFTTIYKHDDMQEDIL